MLALATLMVAYAPEAHADFFSDNYPGYFSLLQPGRLGITVFGGGYISDKFADLQEGAQIEQSVTPYIGVFGRATGYQLFIDSGFDSPLAPGSGHSARLNFGRFQGGLDFTLFSGTHFWISGGKDAGDSHADVIEGDLSSWLWLHCRNPVNASFSSVHNFETGVTSSEIDLQAIVFSNAKYLIMAGAGGAVYGGGFLSSAQGQGGPDIGVYYRPWQFGINAQAGYGTAHQYGQISMYKQLSWLE